MELFIRVKNGQPFEHPIFGENFRQAFPHIDVNALPSEFARFVRVAPPDIGVYEVYEGVTYERNGDGFTDAHHKRQMTDAEKAAKQNAVKADWTQGGFQSWVFDEASCTFTPPTPRPQDGKNYRWDEPTLSWIEVTNV